MFKMGECLLFVTLLLVISPPRLSWKNATETSRYLTALAALLSVSYILLVVKVRVDKNKSLGQIFQLISDHEQALGITEYSVSEATLEQIFLHMAKTPDTEGDSKQMGMVEETLQVEHKTGSPNVSTRQLPGVSVVTNTVDVSSLVPASHNTANSGEVAVEVTSSPPSQYAQGPGSAYVVPPTSYSPPTSDVDESSPPAVVHDDQHPITAVGAGQEPDTSASYSPAPDLDNGHAS